MSNSPGMRISISKPQHRALLTNLADQLEGDPKDALEHVLNCWQVGQMPAPNQGQGSIGAIAQSDDGDAEFIADWS